MAGIFGFFDYTKPGRGIIKSEEPQFTFAGFFKILFRRFWKIVTLNVLFILFCFPVFFYLLAQAGYTNIPFLTPSSQLYQPLYAITQHGANALNQSLGAISDNTMLDMAAYITPLTNILSYMTLLIALTFGFANTGMTYVLRNFARKDHADVWGDFIGAVKRNWKQSLALGILDFFVIYLLIFDIRFFFVSDSSFIMSMGFWFCIIFGLLYIFMRPYMYLMLVTFDLKIKKIIKNSFIFSIVGIKRNIMAFLGIALLAFITYQLFFFMTPLSVLMIMLLLFSLSSFMGIYAAYANIKKIMIDPYYNDEDSGVKEEKIFKDVTENE